MGNSIKQQQQQKQQPVVRKSIKPGVMGNSVKQQQLQQQQRQQLLVVRNSFKPVVRTFMPIVVNSAWLMLDGLVDVNRDVLMKLIRIIDDDKKIRNIIGMTMLFYTWSKQRMFYWARMGWKEECAFRIKCKDGRYGYGKCKGDIDKVCNDGYFVWVYLSLSKTDENMKEMRKAEVVKFDFGRYSGTDIGSSFMYRCESLTTPLRIPNSVTSIDCYFMYGCESLKTPPIIPNSVTYISSYFMYGCKSLKTPPIIPNSITRIYFNFMSGCSSLTTPPIIPNSVTSIGGWFMSGCISLTIPPIIPNSVTSIDSHFMSGCISLTTPPIIPNSVTSIPHDFMDYYTSLRTPPVLPNHLKQKY